MKMHELKAQKRDELGRKVNKLRKEGKLPANIYGKKIKSLSITVDSKDFEKVFKEAGETGIVEIGIDKEKRPTLIHNVQVDPVDNSLLHVDFFQVDLKQKVEAMVPVELVGESPAVKQGLGTIVLYVDEIEVEALPADIPEKFEVSIEFLIEVNQQIKVSEIKVDKSKVEMKEEPDKVLVKVEPLRKEEIPVPKVEAPVGEEEVKEGEETPAEESSEKQKPQKE